MKTEINYTKPDEMGFYGEFGGAYVPELLRPNIEELQEYFDQLSTDEDFQQEFKQLLADYVGRPTPLYLSKKMSAQYGCSIYLKREDLNHTGAHKINNAIGQILLAKKWVKQKLSLKLGLDNMVLQQLRFVL